MIKKRGVFLNSTKYKIDDMGLQPSDIETFEEYLPFIKNIAASTWKKYNRASAKRNGVEFDDIYQIAMVALTRVIQGTHDNKEKRCKAYIYKAVRTNLLAFIHSNEEYFSYDDYDYDRFGAYELQDNIDDDRLRSIFKSLIDGLSFRRREVMEHFLGLNGKRPKSIADIGRVMGVSRQDAQWLYKSSVELLRQNTSKVNELREFR